MSDVQSESNARTKQTVSNRLLFMTWLGIGTQSWGGGAATLTLIRRAVVDRHGWLGEVEFNECWALTQISPGINQFALTILIGRRIGGTRGVLISAAGLLLPSVLITVLLTAAYAAVRGNATARLALRGAIPATVGLGLFTAYQMASTNLKDAANRGRAAGWFAWALLAACIAAMASHRVSPVAILIGAGALGAVGSHLARPRDGEIGP